MHQSIPAVPMPAPPPGATAGHLLTLSARGVTFANFIAARGAGH